MEAFGGRLHRNIQAKGSPVLLGLDPRPELIPDDCFPQGRDTPEAVATGLIRFATRLIEALAPHVAAVKPQIAFYEAWGLAGLRAYVETIKVAQRSGLPVIADIKRGDIGSTAEAYAAAHLGGGGCDDFVADAVTLNPWLGSDSLEPFFKVCRERGKGVYLLLHTSNPGSRDLQEQKLAGGERLYESLASLITRWQQTFEACRWSPVGVVVGATFPGELAALLKRLPHTPFLVPGYGAQGGSGEELRPLFEGGLGAHLVNASRSLTYAWKKNGGTLEEAALKAVLEMKRDLLGSGA